MNGRNKRKKRAQRARDMKPITRGARDPWGGLCPNGCGELGPHYVPPSMGDRGFFHCTPLPKLSAAAIELVDDDGYGRATPPPAGFIRSEGGA